MTKTTLQDVYTGTMYVNENVLETAPETSGELVFFNFEKKDATAQEVDDEYEKRGLAPAGAVHLGTWAEEHKDDERKYFASQWKDKKGRFCYLAFHGWGGERYVGCREYAFDWYGTWWFAGVRKSSALKTSEKPSNALPLELPAELTINGRTYRAV